MSEPATKEDIENVVALIQQNFERVDRRFESVDRRFESVDRQFEVITNRLDRMADTLVSVQSQMAAMTRWADRFDRDHNSIVQTQAAQQRAIDDLAARVTRLEERKAS